MGVTYISTLNNKTPTTYQEFVGRNNETALRNDITRKMKRSESDIPVRSVLNS